MRVDGRDWRTIWPLADETGVGVIDQTKLPFRFETADLRTVEDAAHAIRAMLVRGAPLIGVTAAYGLAIAMRADPSDAHLAAAFETLRATRPTAINLRWALERMRAHLRALRPAERAAAAFLEAEMMADEDVAANFRNRPGTGSR